jgi:hypothetical protein
MWSQNRLPIAVLALGLATLAATPALAPAFTQSTQTKKPLKAPKSGSVYSGHHPKIDLHIEDKHSIQIVAIRFPCKMVRGNTSLQDIKIKKNSKGYRFDIDSFGIVTYSDSEKYPDENAEIILHGRFSRNAKSVAGNLRIKAPRCDTHRILWSAKRT